MSVWNRTIPTLDTSSSCCEDKIDNLRSEIERLRVRVSELETELARERELARCKR